jgi:hypothetical protein
MSNVRNLLLLAVSLTGFTGSEVLRAQEHGSTQPATPLSALDTKTTLNSAGGLANEDILLRTKSGDLIPLRPLLGDRILDELLLQSMEQVSVPRYTIAQQEVSAAVDHDVVTIKVVLQIQLYVAKEWVTIPISFGDVYTTRIDHKSEEANAQAVPTSGEQNSRQLHLYGAGLHTVTLEMIGKAKLLAPGVRQLNLNLPSATASHADFQFALPVELQSLPTGSVDKPTRDDKGVHSVEFWGLPQSFGLSWSDVVQRAAQKPVIQVQNRIKLDLTTIPVNLTGTQSIQISGSPVGELRVTFPAGFQPKEIGARNANGLSVLNSWEKINEPATPETESKAVLTLVRLTTATEGSLTLAFDLELTNRTFPQDIRVALPSIQDANVQSGDLDILFPTGLLVQQSIVEGAQQKRVTAETDLSVAATAFRMRSTESQVVLHVEETEAQFAVSPEIELRPDAQNVIMTAKYPISVLTGALLDLSIYWPGYSSREWQILPGSTRLISGKTSVPLLPQESETETDILQMTFRERQSGEFIVEFRAYAPLADVRSGKIQLRCPEIQGRLGQQFVVTTIESDQYTIRPISMGTGRPLPTVPLPTVPLSGSGSVAAVETDLHSESWLHDDPSIPVRLELPEQAPSVRANLRVGMSQQGAAIEVRETVSFEIEHRDLPTLFLNVPAEIRKPTVRIAGQTEVLRATIDSDTHWSFRLPEARRGILTLEVNYIWTPALSSDPLPLILPEAAEIQSIEVGTESGSGLTVVDSEIWQPVYSERFDAAWYSSSPVATVPVYWQPNKGLVSGHSPDLILARTQIVGHQLLTTTVAIYESLPEVINLETPLRCTLHSIIIDQQSLNSSDSLQKSQIQLKENKELGTCSWQIQTNALKRPMTSQSSGATSDRLHTIELRVSDHLPQRSSLWLLAKLDRAIIIGESPTVPVVWFAGSEGEFRTTSTSNRFTALTHQGSIRPPWNESVRSSSDRQLKAILSPYPTVMQLIAMERIENWMPYSDQQDLFIGSAESGALTLILVPFVSLLLVSAVVCIVFFVLLSLLRRLTTILPLLLAGCSLLLAWLIIPEWTTLLAPYVAVGVVCGVVSVIFQRLVFERRGRFPKASETGEYQTVFGFSGIMSQAVTDRPEPAVPASPVVNRSDFNVSSFV